MKRILHILLISLFVGACGQPKARKPVKVSSGSFYKESIERNKKLLAFEEGVIQKVIARDSLNRYKQSSAGFWYRYEHQNDTIGYHPQSKDKVLISYDLRTLTNDTIYNREQIGVVRYVIDQRQLFPGLRNAVKELTLGESATFIFPSLQGYGYHGDGDLIGPRTPLISTIVLLEVEKHKEENKLNQN